MTANNERTNSWQEWARTVLTLLVLPGALWAITSAADRERVRQDYLRIAVGVLQPNKDLKPPQKELRKWAVALIQDSAPDRAKLSPEAAQSLIDGNATFNYTAPTVSTYDYNYRTPSVSTYDYTSPIVDTTNYTSPRVDSKNRTTPSRADQSGHARTPAQEIKR